MQLKIYSQYFGKTNPFRTSCALDVYYGSADSFLNMIPVLYNFLSDQEKKRADRFKFKSDHDCYISVHALLRLELSKILNIKAGSIKIENSKEGKPFVLDMDLPFSLSRSKNDFSFVIGSGSHFVGIDIEQAKLNIDFEDITRNYFSISEQMTISSIDNAYDRKHFFLKIWTGKEALLKAIGVGLNTDLKKVQVIEGKNHLDIEGVNINADSVYIKTTLENNLIISIASTVDFLPRFKEISL